MMQQRFAGKVVVVTGGNSGIGLHTAMEFAREGAQVVITGRNDHTLEQARQQIGGNTIALRMDAAEVAQIERTMNEVRERFGRVDVLFVNAGTAAILPIEKVSEATWDRLIGVNLKGVFFTVRATVPMMSRGSAIVLNASLGARRCPPFMSVYAASKAGVVALGRTLAIEFAAHGIRVNVVSPGPIETPLPQRTEGLATETLPQLLDPGSATPLGRIGRPSEVSAAVLFLSSDTASFITGTDTVIDGGIAAAP